MLSGEEAGVTGRTPVVGADRQGIRLGFGGVPNLSGIANNNRNLLESQMANKSL